MNINNGVIETKNNQEQIESIGSNNMDTNDVVTGDQSHNEDYRVANDANILTNNEGVTGTHSQVSATTNNVDLNQDNANTSQSSLVRTRPSNDTQPRFQRRRLMPQTNDEPHLQADLSMDQSSVLQPSQPASSQLEGCSNCSEYKVEIKRLRQTNIRLTRNAEESKKRMDNNLAISLNGQEAMQKEVRLLRRNNEKLHIEVTSLRGLLREIQSLIERYKF